MLMNALETALVNNPVRTALLGPTVQWLRDAAPAHAMSRVLEIGCGRGDGILRIATAFGPATIDAFDLDATQLARTRRRLAARPPGRPVHLWRGDVERLPLPDGAYDAVFEFTILHHVPRWVRALDEIRRVLRPGGLFLFEELSLEFFRDVPVVSALLRRFTVHPWDAMFDAAAFRRGMDEAGLRVRRFHTQVVPGWHRGVAVAV